jgi:SAM-dependent methyltransferase
MNREFDSRVDFGKTAADYGRHRAGFPEQFLERLETLGVGLRGQRLLDLGTGTGTLARGFARRGAIVTALDPASSLIDVARQLDVEAGVEVRYLVGRAESTGLAESGFDVVTAGQCWHWFDSAHAAAEVRRVLVPGGRLVIAYFDWIPLPGNVVEATERLIEKHNPAWHFGGGTGLHPRWLADLAGAGFLDLETFSFDVPVRYSHEAWCGRIRASAGVAATLSSEEVARFEAQLQAMLSARFADDPMEVPHRVFAVVGVSP